MREEAALHTGITKPRKWYWYIASLVRRDRSGVEVKEKREGKENKRKKKERERKRQESHASMSS